MNNIYQTPKSSFEPQTEIPLETKLFKVSGITVATFFGSILAGGLLMALNYKRLGSIELAKKTLFYSIIATVMLFTAIFFLPQDLPSSAFYAPQIVVIYQLAKKYQQSQIEKHLAAGGLAASNWAAFGISLLMVVPIFIIIFIGVIFTS